MRQLTQAEIARALEMYSAGDSVEKMASVFGCSPFTFYRHIRRAGIVRPPGYPSRLPLAQVKAEHKTGVSCSELAKKYGVHDTTMLWHLKRAGVYKRGEDPKKYPDGYVPVERKCSKCKQVKDTTNFYKSSGSPGGYAYECIECKRKYPTTRRCLAARYGLTEAAYNELVLRSNGQCTVCNGQFKSGRDAHIDHCHTHSVVRGLLCALCNVGLGAFRDSPKLLRDAATYLELP